MKINCSSLADFAVLMCEEKQLNRSEIAGMAWRWLDREKVSKGTTCIEPTEGHDKQGKYITGKKLAPWIQVWDQNHIIYYQRILAQNKVKDCAVLGGGVYSLATVEIEFGIEGRMVKMHKYFSAPHLMDLNLKSILWCDGI